MNREYSIVFWFNQPPKVEVGSYNYVSNHINGNTYYVCAHDLPSERKALGWDRISYGSAKLIVLSNEINDRNEEIEKYVNIKNAVHIMCGLRGSIADEICPILKRKGIKFYVVSERPSLAYNSIKNAVHSIGAKILHKLRYIQYKNYVIAFLALGNLGVAAFRKIGWPENKLFRFMYCGEYDEVFQSIKKVPDNSIVKFLYIGRFKYKTHAVDILQSAFDNQQKNNWTLDLAGGYGEDKEKVINWINSVKNARFIGKVNASEVQTLMSHYDIVLVPSRSDGWNCQINEALFTNTPVITTIESVSSELVSKSGGGIVVDEVSIRKFTEAIEHVISNVDIISEWSNSILNYKESFSPKAVGEYLMDIIEYTNNLSPENKRPKCPW